MEQLRAAQRRQASRARHQQHSSDKRRWRLASCGHHVAGRVGHCAAAQGISAVRLGDTLTHLPDLRSVERLFADVAEMLIPGGAFIIRFRDYSTPLLGPGRFIPVRSAGERLLTCFLDYEDEHTRPPSPATKPATLTVRGRCESEHSTAGIRPSSISS